MIIQFYNDANLLKRFIKMAACTFVHLTPYFDFSFVNIIEICKGKSITLPTNYKIMIKIIFGTLKTSILNMTLILIEMKS